MTGQADWTSCTFKIAEVPEIPGQTNPQPFLHPFSHSASQNTSHSTAATTTPGSPHRSHRIMQISTSAMLRSTPAHCSGQQAQAAFIRTCRPSPFGRRPMQMAKSFRSFGPYSYGMLIYCAELAPSASMVTVVQLQC